ncbi:hypothetical protein Tco_0625613, partial [Tanacetum coccineum]
MTVEESLNVTFDESPPPIKLSPLVDDDVGEEDAIKKNTKIVNTNNKEDESIEVDEIIYIKESKNHPLDQVRLSALRMSQYLTHTDYALWEVIINGDAPAIASASTECLIPPKTVKQKLARKNKLKAKSTLLLAIPDDHLLKFHGIKDAKTLWEAIKT